MPRVVDHKERRTLVTDAALRVILKDGMQGATMRSIAAEAHCTTGLLTHYFANKDELLLEMVRQLARRARRRLSKAAADLRGIDALRALLIESTPLTPGRSDEWRIWIALWDRAVTNDKLREDWDMRTEAWAKMISVALHQAIEDGELRPDVPVEEIVESLAATNYGMGVIAVLTPRRMHDDDVHMIVSNQVDQIVAVHGNGHLSH